MGRAEAGAAATPPTRYITTSCKPAIRIQHQVEGKNQSEISEDMSCLEVDDRYVRSEFASGRAVKVLADLIRPRLSAVSLCPCNDLQRTSALQFNPHAELVHGMKPHIGEEHDVTPPDLGSLTTLMWGCVRNSEERSLYRRSLSITMIRSVESCESPSSGRGACIRRTGLQFLDL